jgi:putative PIN family toxin of toxin-antitoxin system
VIRVVIDTNVLVSALISPSGNEALVVLAIAHGLIKPCFSAEIIKEYVEVLARPKFSFPPDEIESLLQLFRDRGDEVASSVRAFDVLPDPGDAKFLVCAQQAGVDLLVTGNRRHFPRKACKGFEVVNSVELLYRIALEI